jgi:hypothetical protein
MSKKKQCVECGTFLSNPISKELGKCRQCAGDINPPGPQTGRKILFKKAK